MKNLALATSRTVMQISPKLKQVLGYVPTVSLKDGLKVLVDEKNGS